MKKSKKADSKVSKKLKKLFYRGKITGFKRMLAFMLVGGIVLAALFSVKHVYQQYAIARANVSLLYPEIAAAKYPDESRFTYYDLISDDKIAQTLAIMQQNGMYEYYTVEDIKNNIYVYNYLDNSAKDEVSNARLEGNDYSYVANEYKLTFIQPHDYKNKNILKKLFSPDYSETFLETLIEVNKKEFTDVYGGYAGFELLTDINNTEKYDYSELIGVYRTKIGSVIDYLNELETASPGFVSESTGMGVKDVVGEYELLLTNKLDSIDSFIDTSGISRNREVASNKLKVNIENNELRYVKYKDKVDINKYAQDSYDHTFTENLIVVTIHEQNGLYQARPKTAFDTVVSNKHEAIKNVEEFETKIGVLKTELQGFSSTAVSNSEYKRLCEKCEALLLELESEYTTVTEIARTLVKEYGNSVNKAYVKFNITDKSVFTSSFFINTGIAFAIGIAVVFILSVALSVTGDSLKMRKKNKMLRNIHQDGRSVQQ